MIESISLVHMPSAYILLELRYAQTGNFNSQSDLFYTSYRNEKKMQK